MEEGTHGKTGFAIDLIMRQIYNIRGQKVVLDFQPAILYDVETRTLKQAVRRKKQRFPPDCMFQLTKEEW